MSLYRVPARPDPEDAPLFDYAAEAARKERVAARIRTTVGAAIAILLAFRVGDASVDASLRPWLPVLLMTALAVFLLVAAYRVLDELC